MATSLKRSGPRLSPALSEIAENPYTIRSAKAVMAGLVPAIHDLQTA